MSEPRRALIGHTGFVGGNLSAQTHFDDLYNSSNIEAIAGKSYELMVCAGAPAAKWKANQEPERDLANLRRLMACLAEARASHFVLISTVDVYPDPVAVDEDTPIDGDSGGPYGRHRLMLERFVAERFAHTTLRLPGLFGPGLKKNVVYDFLHDNQTDLISPESTFQFYPLVRLWQDVETARRHALRLVNLATEPVSVRQVAREAFGFEFTNPKPARPAHYDMRTRHDRRYGGGGGYVLDAARVLDEMRSYVASTGWRRR